MTYHQKSLSFFAAGKSGRLALWLLLWFVIALLIRLSGVACCALFSQPFDTGRCSASTFLAGERQHNTAAGLDALTQLK
ncbi:MAG: hypothetical protein WBD47_22645 [Phormidesmis sp.]